MTGKTMNLNPRSFAYTVTLYDRQNSPTIAHADNMTNALLWCNHKVEFGAAKAWEIVRNSDGELVAYSYLFRVVAVQPLGNSESDWYTFEECLHAARFGAAGQNWRIERSDGHVMARSI